MRIRYGCDLFSHIYAISVSMKSLQESTGFLFTDKSQDKR